MKLLLVEKMVISVIFIILLVYLMSGELGFPSLGMNFVSLFMEIIEDQGVALVTGRVGAVVLILSLSLIYMILIDQL